MKKFENILTTMTAKTVMLCFVIVCTLFCIGVGAMYTFDTLIVVTMIAGVIGTVVTGYSILQDIMD